MRIPAALSGTWLRTGDLRPLRQFIKEINESDGDSYYRRKALEAFSLRLYESVRNRGHNMPAKEMQSYRDAAHLLVTLPKKEIISHYGLQSAVMMKVATDVIAKHPKEGDDSASKGNVVSQIKDDTILPDRRKILAGALYKKQPQFWGQMVQVMKFNAPNPNFRPSDELRQKRVEELLKHPLVMAGMVKEEELWEKMERNKWVKKEERDSVWGKLLMATWEGNRTKSGFDALLP